jgi:type IV secretory pathway TrbF-like protein
MENTATAILAGLGTMLLVAAVVTGLVWLTYRLAERT